jgi:hypothetical protein
MTIGQTCNTLENDIPRKTSMHFKTSDPKTSPTPLPLRRWMAAHLSLVGVLVLVGWVGMMAPKSAEAKPTAATVALEPTLLRPTVPPVAKIKPTGGMVTVTLNNNTNTEITYQAIGDTEERSLPARSSITLRNLKTPTSLTFYRSDRGFLIVQPKATGSTLALSLMASDDFSIDKTFMEIKANGEVYLN